MQASLYVDDLQIRCEGSDRRHIEWQFQIVVNNLIKWYDANGHSISASKSCCVHCCRKRDLHPDLEIYISCVLILVVRGVRFLGVIFDQRLTFLTHILHFRQRVSTSIAISFLLDLREKKLFLAYYFKIVSVPSHPLQNVKLTTSMKRLYDARPSYIQPFMDRMKRLVTELDLPNVDSQQGNVLLLQPWNTPSFHSINPFATYSKTTVTPVIFQ
ncbi:putative RNA-directed DNA polymerase from transposon X-element [Trichonephila clavipes]|nr:putative RNA-directed DNA polymerase from transposon X-element [Trichonephila clavipes]